MHVCNFEKMNVKRNPTNICKEMYFRILKIKQEFILSVDFPPMYLGMLKPKSYPKVHQKKDISGYFTHIRFIFNKFLNFKINFLVLYVFRISSELVSHMLLLSRFSRVRLCATP